MKPEDLQLLVTREMPFGKYKGRLIADLPGNYLARDPLHNSRHARSGPKRDDLLANTAQRVLKHTQGVW